MGSSGTLLDDTAATLGLPRASLKNVLRALHLAGLIKVQGRGSAAAPMMARDAATLLCGIASNTPFSDTAERTLMLLRLPFRDSDRKNWPQQLETRLLTHSLIRLEPGHTLGDALTVLVEEAGKSDIAKADSNSGEFNPFAEDPRLVRIIIGVGASGRHGYAIVEAAISSKRHLRSFYSTMKLKPAAPNAPAAGVDGDRFETSDDLIVWYEFTGQVILRMAASLATPVKRRGKKSAPR